MIKKILKFQFDLVVIGAGSGGLAAAKRAAGYGAKVAIIESNRIGGTCVIKGCVPKKLMVYAAYNRKNMINSEGYGLSNNGVSFDSSTLLQNVREEVSRLSKLHENSLNKLNIKVINGFGRFVNENQLEIICPNSRNILEKISADKILISVGAKPKKIEIPGVDLAYTSDDIFLLKAFPKNITIVGGGYIACEFASIFKNLGVAVTQLIRGDNLLNGFDYDLASSLKESMISLGVNMIFNNELTSIKKVKGNLESTLKSGSKLLSQKILIATGREPALDDLNLNCMNLKMKDLFISVNQFNQTNIPNIFAVGDITDKPNLTPVAIEQGRVFADNFFGNSKRKVNYKFIPKAVFTIPEISSVGLSEQEAKENYTNANIRVYRCEFTPMSNTFNKNKSKCMLKLIVNKLNDEILGCHMFGDSASEIIQMAAISLNKGVTKKEFDLTMALHPTISEEFVTMYG